MAGGLFPAGQGMNPTGTGAGARSAGPRPRADGPNAGARARALHGPRPVGPGPRGDALASVVPAGPGGPDGASGAGPGRSRGRCTTPDGLFGGGAGAGWEGVGWAGARPAYGMAVEGEGCGRAHGTAVPPAPLGDAPTVGGVREARARKWHERHKRSGGAGRTGWTGCVGVGLGVRSGRGPQGGHVVGGRFARAPEVRARGASEGAGGVRGPGLVGRPSWVARLDERAQSGGQPVPDG